MEGQFLCHSDHRPKAACINGVGDLINIPGACAQKRPHHVIQVVQRHIQKAAPNRCQHDDHDIFFVPHQAKVYALRQHHQQNAAAVQRRHRNQVENRQHQIGLDEIAKHLEQIARHVAQRRRNEHVLCVDAVAKHLAQIVIILALHQHRRALIGRAEQIARALSVLSVIGHAANRYGQYRVGEEKAQNEQNEIHGDARDGHQQIVPAIVSEELWDKANDILKRRSEDVKNRQGICNHANLLTGKLWCTRCAQPYYRRESRDKSGNKNSKWLCSGKIKNGADSCGSFAIYEEEIKPVLYEVFRDTKADADAMVAEYVRMYNELTINGALPQKMEEQQKIIDLANRKKNKLLQLAADDSITNADFKSMTAACNEEIRAAEEEIAELEQAALEGEEFRRKIDEIRKVLASAQRDAASGVITKEFVDKYIDKIFVTPTDDNTLLLQIKIFTGETTEKYLRKFEHRVGIITGELTEQQGTKDAARGSEPCVSAGHTFKKMIEAYEQGLQ